jgi:uncharacterized membrane protein YphA (DoxX/SURF4 family)
MELPATIADKITLVFRIVLGGLFLFSSVGKIADPNAFAAIVTNYQLLPQPLVMATAVIFPWVEVLCGVALLCGRFDKGAALLVCLMMLAFTGIGLYNAHRGLNIACGCFSLSATEPSNVAVNTLRNLLILAAGAWVFFASYRRQPERPLPQRSAL